MTRVRLAALLLALLLAATAALAPAALVAADASFAQITPDLTIAFPADSGAHPDFRTEWWYVTGWLQDESGHDMGFQVTFFRSRLGGLEQNPSRFTPHQILMAHAALSDPRQAKVQFSQRAAREGFGVAAAATGDTHVKLLGWTLDRDAATGILTTHIMDDGLVFDLNFTPTQAPLLEGEHGFSRKGPRPGEASAYYSLPQLKVGGTVEASGRRFKVSGRAWLDHEWSSNYLGSDAAGWDWLCVNFDDGAALMAFRMRDVLGQTVFQSATMRGGNGAPVVTSGDLTFSAGPLWQSPHSGIRYPIDLQVSVGPYRLKLDALMADQEIDARASTGTRYWEGAVRVTDLNHPGVAGQGYLELTGYGSRLRLQ